MSKSIKTQKIYKIDFFGREEPDGPAEQRDPWLYSASEFDEHGNLVSETSYTPDGEPEQVASYTYDTNDKLASEKFIQEGDDFSEWREYIRHEDGKMKEEIHHFLDGTQDVVAYHYADNGKLMRKTFTNDEGDLEREEVFMYEETKLVEEKIVSFDGDILARHTFSYHPNGAIQEHQQFIPEDLGDVRHHSFYDESGNKTKVLVYNAQGHLVEISRMTYNENNALIKTEEENQVKNAVIEYEEDGKGNPVKQIEKDADGKLISSVTRSYDEDGRLLGSTVFVEANMHHAAQDYMLKYEYDFFSE